MPGLTRHPVQLEPWIADRVRNDRHLKPILLQFLTPLKEKPQTTIIFFVPIILSRKATRQHRSNE